MAQEYVVAIFPSRGILTKALDHITRLKDFEFVHAAIVARAKDGEIIVLGDDLSADEGGVAGGTLGAAMTLLGLVQLGALALPGVGPIVALGAGALLGGLVGNATGRFAANLVESGFKVEQIDGLTQHLEAGHPALVLQVDDSRAALDRLRAELKDFRAELIERLPAVRGV
jgi:uncharacterized membrane protein